MPRKRINAKTKIEDPWKALSSAISDTLSAKESDLRLTMIMQACNDLVGKGKFDLIYNGLCDLLKVHFKEWHDQLVNIAGDPLLTKLSDIFDYFKKYSVIFPTFYSSYDQHFSSEPNKILNTIRKLFVLEILSDEKLFKKAATPSILEVIYNAQKGSDVDLSKVSNIIQMYYSFNGKNDKPEIFLDFFDRLKQQENDFCDTFYDNNFATSSFTTYLTNTSKQFTIINRILNERNLLKEKEANEILTNFNLSLLHLKEDDFLTGDEPPIAEALTSEDLRPMNYLVKTYLQFNFDTEPLYLACAQYIKNEMLKQAQDFPEVDEEKKDQGKTEEKKAETKPEKKGEKKEQSSSILSLVGHLIERTLTLSKPYKKIFVDPRKKDKKELEELNKKIKEAWNDKRFNISLTFNDYIDALILSKFKGYDFNEQLDIIPQFYTYLEDKAKFNLYYEASFVRRLIRMRSSIEEYDYPVINCIQKHTTDFMKNLDSFKKALSDSDQLKEDYKAAYPESDKNVSIEPFVFEYNVFPLPKDKFESIPSMAQDSNKQFQSFYHTKHSKKSLTLVYQGSLVEFSIKIPAKKKTFSVTTDLPCGCVISALAQKPIKFGDIIALLNNDKPLANKVIQKLYQKAKLIVPKEKISKLTPDDVFMINPNYSNDKVKVNISPVIQGEWRAHIPNVYELEKKEAIKFAIIRSLKQRQKMESGDLERDIMAKLREKFEITAEMIRRGVAQLENKYVRSDTVDGRRIITYIG